MLKKISILLTLTLLLGCTSNTDNFSCFKSIPVSVSTDLNNPQLINAQIPGGFANLNGGAKGILLFNVNGTKFVAYDKICPQGDCDAPMTFENGLTLKCSCDNSEYSVHFGGAPQTDNFECPAREYRVLKNGSSIRITNF